jgi:hypothetical protein
VGGDIIHVSPVRRFLFSVIEIYLALQKTKDFFLTCSGKVSDYICSSEGLNWIWNYSILCFEFCFVSCSGGVLVGRRRALSCYC